MSAQRITTHLISVTLLLLWGGVMVYFYLSGRIGSYLPPDGAFRPLALAAGLALIALAVLNLATMGAQDPDAAPEAVPDHDHSCCGHNHCATKESAPGGRALAVLILSVPLLAAAAMSPDRFSMAAIVNKGLYSSNYAASNVAPPSRLTSSKTASTAKVSAPAPLPQTTPPAPAPVSATLATTPDAGPRVPGSSAAATASVVVTTLPPAGSPSGAAPAPGSTPPAAPTTTAAGKSYGSFTLEDLKAQVPQSKDGNFILEVPELYYTAGDKEVQGVLAGQPVETTAQVLPEKVNNADGKRLRVFRLLVQCCAADARPYSVPVEFADKAPVMKEMTWVKVIGKMGYRQEGGQTVPIIEAKSITETTAPDNSMLY